MTDLPGLVFGLIQLRYPCPVTVATIGNEDQSLFYLVRFLCSGLITLAHLFQLDLPGIITAIAAAWIIRVGFAATFVDLSPAFGTYYVIPFWVNIFITIIRYHDSVF